MAGWQIARLATYSVIGKLSRLVAFLLPLKALLFTVTGGREVVEQWLGGAVTFETAAVIVSIVLFSVIVLTAVLEATSRKIRKRLVGRIRSERTHLRRGAVEKYLVLLEELAMVAVLLLAMAVLLPLLTAAIIGLGVAALIVALQVRRHYRENGSAERRLDEEGIAMVLRGAIFIMLFGFFLLAPPGTGRELVVFLVFFLLARQLLGSLQNVIEIGQKEAFDSSVYYETRNTNEAAS